MLFAIVHIKHTSEYFSFELLVSVLNNCTFISYAFRLSTIQKFDPVNVIK